MSTLVTGSIAYDTIMVFPDRFRNHLLADQLHILNVCFLTPQMRREFGGTAGNIAYNLKLLGEAPMVMATVGEDSGPYIERLRRLGISTGLLKQIPGQFTAQAFITTDLDDNQITAFHPGAMSHAHLNAIGDVNEAALAIVSPDGRQGMVEHARDLSAAGIPYVFDPGQGLPMFSGNELMEMMRGARALAVNDYEARVVEQKTRLLTLEKLVQLGLGQESIVSFRTVSSLISKLSNPTTLLLAIPGVQAPARATIRVNERLLLGIPRIQAHRFEVRAPPSIKTGRAPKGLQSRVKRS